MTFKVMMRPRIITHSGTFLEEELISVDRFMMGSVRTLVALGDVTFVHWRTAHRHGVDYVAVDPQDGEDKVNGPGARHVRKPFEDLHLEDLPPGPRGFLFSFNLYSYLERPLGKLYSLLRPGDMVCASTWTGGAPARLGYMDAVGRVIGRPLPHLDSDPRADFAHVCALLPTRTAPWQQVNLASTQTFLRYPE